MIKAIETRYKGYRFRSRLEARWAVLFDHMGVEWDYEPEGFDLGQGIGAYLPDFFVKGNGHRGPYVEIKGKPPTNAEIEKLVTLCEANGAYGVLIWGTPGDGGWISVHKEGFRDGEEQFNDLWNSLVFLKVPAGAARVLFERGVEAARSARFEHGETPQ